MPVGRIIRYNNKWDFRVTGVLQDIPNNTDRRQEIYLPQVLQPERHGWKTGQRQCWGQVRSGMNFFIRIKPGIDPTLVDRQFPALIKKYDPDDVTSTTFRLQPLTDIHFNTDFDGSVSKSFLWASISIWRLFCIATACVNFINLATARALNRAKEVGIRKVMGSLRAQLFWQFIFETTMLVLFAFALACGLTILALPASRIN